MREPHSGGPLGNWGRGPDSGGTAFGDHLTTEVLDLLEAGDIRPPTEAGPGWRTQLTYLTTRRGGQQAMADAGIRPRTRRAWPRRTPNPTNQERLNRAYWQLRATNWRRSGHAPPVAVRAALVPQLAERARGRRMTITPVDWRDVREQARGAQRTAAEREIRPSDRRWARLIDAWATGDETDLDSAWMDFSSEIDSPAELYYEVAHIGFVL